MPVLFMTSLLNGNYLFDLTHGGCLSKKEKLKKIKKFKRVLFFLKVRNKENVCIMQEKESALEHEMELALLRLKGSPLS